MKKNTFFFIIIFLFIITTHSYAETKFSSASFTTYLEFENGDGSNQLFWVTDQDGVLITGPLIAPMSFISLPNGDIWIADTQNGRLCLFSKDCKNLKEIDLIKLGKSINLEKPPAIADICLFNDKILAADANSNSILEINTESLAIRQFKSPDSETAKGKWTQISRLYSDNENRIYIDDIVEGKIFILNQNGEYIGENIAASIEVDTKNSNMACIHYVDAEDADNTNSETETNSEVTDDNDSIQFTQDENSENLNTEQLKQDFYQLAVNKGYKTDWFSVSDIKSDEDILYISVIGIDKDSNIYIMYNTEHSCTYNIYTFEGDLIKSIETSLIATPYNPSKYSWINENGDIFTVTIADKKLKIYKLVEEKKNN